MLRKTEMKIVLKNSRCGVCGKVSDFVIQEKAVLFREAHCCICGASLRNSDLGKEITRVYLKKINEGLENVLFEMAGYRVLNTCSTGAIHNSLKTLPGYIASEYYDDVPNGSYRGTVLCADLMHLPLDNDSLDLIISEDVFEHIDDYDSAFREISRVLVVGGYHIFTVPYHEGRLTKSRKNKKDVYHGDPIREKGSLVITDFGYDLPDLLKKYGMMTEVIYANTFYKPEDITDVDESYSEYVSKMKKMDEYFKYNSIIFVSRKCNSNEKTIDDSIDKPMLDRDLIEKYCSRMAIESFDADRFCEEVRKNKIRGIYDTEGGEGDRFAWVSDKMEMVLRNYNYIFVRVSGYINMDLYNLIDIDDITITICISYGDKSVSKSVEFKKNQMFDIDIDIRELQSKKYLSLRIDSSNSVCPIREKIGRDKRNLSWILKSIVGY